MSDAPATPYPSLLSRTRTIHICSPSALSVVADQQECLLGLAEGAHRRIDDLKMRLIKRDFSVESRVQCAAFLTFVLRFEGEGARTPKGHLQGPAVRVAGKPTKLRCELDLCGNSHDRSPLFQHSIPSIERKNIRSIDYEALH